MNTKTTFLKGLGVITVIGLLSLIVGSSLAPVKASDVVLVSVAITASPGTICSGQSAHITWSSTDATSVSINQGIGSVLPYGDRYVSPTQTTTYIITGTNSTGGFGTASATVFVSASCPTPIPTSTVTPGAGTLTAYCQSPTSIVLNWSSGVNANSNSIQKGDLYPNDPNQFWNFVLQDHSLSLRTYTDTNILPGIVYSYRVKYRPELPSNVVTISCNYLQTPTPTPYPTYSPTPYPTATPYATLAISQYGRNVTRGQNGEYASLKARGNDTLDLIFRVRNNSGATANNVYLTDSLPAGLRYVSNSSTLNGRVVADGITTYGLNIGSLYANQEAMVKISVTVDPAYVPASGQVVIYNTVNARADNTGTVSAQLPITLTKDVIGTVGTVNTGPIDSIVLALAMSVLATGMYAGYTRSGSFSRRLALSEIRQTMNRKTAPNFAR